MASFSTLTAFHDILSAQPTADAAATTGAQDRNGQLTKPPGALGRLADLAIWVPGWQRAGLENKTRVVAEGVALHGQSAPLDVLRCLGGRELAAMAGAIAAILASAVACHSGMATFAEAGVADG